MAVHDHPHRHLGFRFPSLRKAGTAPASADTTTAAATATRAYALMHPCAPYAGSMRLCGARTARNPG